jgi:putative transposase
LHAKALELLTQGIHLVSTDEMSGIQALERLHPTVPMRPGRVERHEFEYIRHGTQTLIANWHIAKGQVITASVGATRTEQDFYCRSTQHSQIRILGALGSFSLWY